MVDATRVKICGLKTKKHVDAAAAAGAAYVGFVFFQKSPRFVSPETASVLAKEAPAGLCKVGLVVNASDDDLDQIMESVPLDLLQLHGAESPERVSEIKSRFGLPVMKAVGVAGASDLDNLDIYAQVADQVLVDAKPHLSAVWHRPTPDRQLAHKCPNCPNPMRPRRRLLS